MPDARISELPLATAPGDADLAPLVQANAAGTGTETRRATLAQLRGAVLADRGAHVRDYGAKGDGTTDDAPAIQAAVNDLKAKGGGTLQFGARTYRIASPVLVEGATVRLQGLGFTEGGPGSAQGTWLLVDGTGFTPFTFTGTMARGGGLRDIAVRQTHAAALDAAWAPTSHDWVVRIEDCLGGVDLDNLFLCGVDKGVYCRNSGRLDIRRLRGQVFTRGVEIDECYDVPRIHNLHLWPFWSDNANVVRWQQANGDAMVFRRSDGVFVDQAFALGYRSMFRFAASAAGATTKFYIGQAYVDFCRYGVWVEADGTDGQIANLTTHGEIFASGGQPLAGSHGLRLAATGARVQVGNLRVDSVEDNPIRVEGSGNRLDVFALRCVRYNSRGNGAAAIHVADSGAAAPNAVYLGAPPLLEGPSPGPLVNAGTNGILAKGAPAGRAARPGLMLGGTDTGLFAPAAATLAAAAGGSEVLRATATGTITLGGAPGGHALEVATPPSAANRLLVSGAAAGGAVAVQAQGADANIGLALVPKGTGALTAGVPDGAVAGGGARGANAVDWQTARVSASLVASGAYATVSGGRNNAAGGTHAVVGGGIGNVAGDTAVVSGGNGNTADGVVSWIVGGFRATTRNLFGKGAWASGWFSAPGDAQAGEQVLRRQTADATPAALTADGGAPGAGNQVVLPNGGVYACKVLVAAREATGAGKGVWEFLVSARRDGSAAATNVSAQSTGAPILSGATTGWAVSLVADTANGAMQVQVTGAAGQTIRWVARVLSAEVVS